MNGKPLMFGSFVYYTFLAIMTTVSIKYMVSKQLSDYIYPVLVNWYDRVIYISSYIQVELSQYCSVNKTKFDVLNTAVIRPMCVTGILCTHTTNESHILGSNETCGEDGVVTIDYENTYNIMRNSYAYDPKSVESLITSINTGCATLVTASPMYMVMLVTVVSGKIDLSDLFIKLAGPSRDYCYNLDVTLDSLLVTLQIDCHNDNCNDGSWYFYGPHGCSGIPVADSDLFTIQHVLNLTKCNQKNHLDE
jgi:hypothetical protein